MRHRYYSFEFGAFISNDPLDDVLNSELSHEHYFFDDGSNIGFGPKGRFPEDPSAYKDSPSSGYYDDDIMREALDRLKDKPYDVNPFDPNRDNCQEWAERLRDEYERVKQEQDLQDQDVPVIRPIDPNDKIGPNGVGPNRVVSAQDELEYMIRFENLASASAPVQELIVVDYLDAGLDWTTVRFKEIAYGDRIVTPPVGSQSFTVRDQPPTNSSSLTGSAVGSMVIGVRGTANPQTGRLEWRVTALDTNTGFWPMDALSGFLPPENGTGRGQGYVKLGVRPKNNLPIGTAITNIATIVFDGNEPIDTPPVWNLVGDVPSLAATIAYLPGQIMVGTPFTYTIGLTNNGTNLVENVILTNALPAGVSAVKSGWGSTSQTAARLAYFVGGKPAAHAQPRRMSSPTPGLLV